MKTDGLLMIDRTGRFFMIRSAYLFMLNLIV